MSNETLMHAFVMEVAVSAFLMVALTGRVLKKNKPPHLLLRDLPTALKLGLAQYAVAAFAAGPLVTWGQQTEAGPIAIESDRMLPGHVFMWLAILAWLDLPPPVVQRILMTCLPVIGCTSVLLAVWCFYAHDWWTIRSIGYYGFLALFGVTAWHLLSPLSGSREESSVSE